MLVSPHILRGSPAHPQPIESDTRAREGLVIDAPDQEYAARPGEQKHSFTFRVTNRSDVEMVVERVKTSCGCSLARVPAQPWKLPPGESGEFAIEMDFTGKTGVLTKTATVETGGGRTQLSFKVIIPAAPAPEGDAMRTRNIQLAAADRQAVFKNDCASCHAAPTVGLHGEPLYAAACGICHDAEHRASMVPDLKAMQAPLNRDAWLATITHGKPGTLMPAFARAEGGPLSRDQIDSLVEYLVTAFERDRRKDSASRP